jgi:polyphosphate glucokinase
LASPTTMTHLMLFSFTLGEFRTTAEQTICCSIEVSSRLRWLNFNVSRSTNTLPRAAPA